MTSLLRSLSLITACALTACGTERSVSRQMPDLPDGEVPARHGTVILVGCSLDGWQREALFDPSTARVIQDVVLLCLEARAAGDISPSDPETVSSISSLANDLHAQGYQVILGLSPGNFIDQPYGPNQTMQLLHSAGWRASVLAQMATWKPVVDGFDLALSPVPDSSRDDVTAFVREAEALVHPDRSLGVFLPPSQSDPSDIVGGEAFDVPALSDSVDRFRLMTLDYASDNPPGPTLETGWGVDVYRLAASRTDVPLDVSFPLYGTDFSDLGQRSVTYLEAVALGAAYGAQTQRGPTGAPHVAYTDADGHVHDVWFDDAYSSILALQAWGPSALPPSVGVTFYGLGAEDPTLWRALAGRMR